MKTYIKPTSHTQRQAKKAVSVIDQVCQLAGIDFDEWLQLLFEMGCRYAENVAQTHEEATHLKTDPAAGFWAAWIHIYLQDDTSLLSLPTLFLNNGYAEQKLLLVDYFNQ